MLRTTSNFLLSLAAFLEPCRPFLKKYFCAAVRLPTDWIEVAELYQVSIGSPGQPRSPGHYRVTRSAHMYVKQITVAGILG